MERDNGNSTEVANLMEGEWSCYRGGQFNGWGMVVIDVERVMEGELSCYGGGQFNEGRMVMLQKSPV